MSYSDDKQIRRVAEEIRAIERFWRIRLPDTLHHLYRNFPYPFVAPCEFFALEAILGGAGREFGMLPSFLPFGRAVGEGGVYGLYVTPENEEAHLPILYWDSDEMFLKPVASDFETFLRHCILVGRFETEEQWPDAVGDPEEEDERLEFGRLLGMPPDLLVGPVPRNDTELYEKLVTSDPQDAVSLCHLGCMRLGQRDEERALDFFHRASEAAPWFGDPLYLVANVYREREQYDRAVRGWWSVVQCLLPLCTRTWEWNLGEEHPEADIYEVAADALTQFARHADPDCKSNPLWHAVTHDDPYDPDARESLADVLLMQNDLVGAEREYLNALSLCCSEGSRQPDRIYDALIDLYMRQNRTRDASLARHDRSLPRPAV